jgi:hypothetical protein
MVFSLSKNDVSPSKNSFSLSENHFPASVHVKQISLKLRAEVIEV